MVRHQRIWYQVYTSRNVTTVNNKEKREFKIRQKKINFEKKINEAQQIKIWSQSYKLDIILNRMTQYSGK